MPVLVNDAPGIQSRTFDGRWFSEVSFTVAHGIGALAKSRAPPAPWAGDLGILHKARDIAVGVLDRSHQLARADVARLLLDRRASGNELLDCLVDVVDKPVRNRRGHPLLVAVRVESNVLPTDVPAYVIRRFVGRRGAQQRGVDLLRALQILDRVDKRLHA